MKFDPERVIENIERLSQLESGAASDSEVRQTEVVAHELRALGLIVDRRLASETKLPRQLKSSPVRLTSAFLATFSLISLAFPSLRSPVFITLTIGVLLCLEYLRITDRQLLAIWPRSISAPLVMARQGRDSGAPFRVVFQVRVTDAPTDTLHQQGMSNVLIPIAIICLALAGSMWMTRIGALVGSTLLWWSTFRALQRDADYLESLHARSSNLAGPAFLLELARDMSATRPARFESIFVVVGGQGAGWTVNRELCRIAIHEWGAKPTLQIVIHAPGVGRIVRIARSHRSELAIHAAKDLWIPHDGHRGLWEKVSRRWLTPVPIPRADQISLSGDTRRDEPTPKIDRQSLYGMAGLVTEVALRWVRQESEKGNTV